MTVESDGVSNEHLNPFNLINLSEILFLIQGSKSTTCPHCNTNNNCVLDPINSNRLCTPASRCLLEIRPWVSVKHLETILTVSDAV